jgi:hypothetical protein
MSDWLAQISGVASALAGLDMSMPGDINEVPLFGNSYWMYEYSRVSTTSKQIAYENVTNFLYRR